MPEVRGYIEQLSGNGLLRQTDSEFPVLELTDDGVALLKDAAAQPGLVARTPATPDEGPRAKTREGRRGRGVAGRRPRSLRAAARPCASRSPEPEAFHPTSSSTTRRCATWRVSSRRRWTPCAMSTAWVSARRRTLGRPSSRRLGHPQVESTMGRLDSGLKAQGLDSGLKAQGSGLRQVLEHALEGFA